MVSPLFLFQFLLVIFLFIFVGYFLFEAVFMTISNLFGAPFVVSSQDKLRVIKGFIPKQKDIKIIDLGSGDGTIISELLKSNIQADGIEVNPFLVFLSRYKIKKTYPKASIKIIWKSFWQKDFSDYDVIIIFGLPWVMKRLEKKFKKELKKGTLIISNGFKFPNWPVFQGKKGVFLYKA
jgi:hypothetical protein